MMNKTINLSNNRLSRAKEDLESAKLNLDNGLLKASINRSYYCILHSIRAVNALKGFDAKTHSEVISYFHQYFIHTEDFNKDLYLIINKAHRTREKSDFDDFYKVSLKDTEEQFENAKYFLGIAENFLLDKYIYLLKSK